MAGAAIFEDYFAGGDEAERAEALKQFLARGGRYPAIADELDRNRLEEIEADYRDDMAAGQRPPRREHAAIEL